MENSSNLIQNNTMSIRFRSNFCTKYTDFQVIPKIYSINILFTTPKCWYLDQSLKK